MKTKIDNEKYGTLAQEFLKLLKEHVLLYLDETLDDIEGVNVDDVDKELKKVWSEDFTFGIAAVLDGSANLVSGGKVITPYLGFLVEDEKEVVFDDGNIALHELVNLLGDDVITGLFEKKDETKVNNDKESFFAEIKFENDLYINYQYWGWPNEEEKEEKIEFSKEFYKMFYSTMYKKRVSEKISNISPLLSNIEEINITLSTGVIKIKETGMADLSISDLFDLMIARSKSNKT